MVTQSEEKRQKLKGKTAITGCCNTEMKAEKKSQRDSAICV
jgi:hypothetical protein